ncbi:MAG: nucleoside triphosphate pyrophosphatase [Pirellulales bacterium]
MSKPHLILASGSPRRKQLLAAAGHVFEIIRPEVDEDPGKCSNCGPAELVAELAFQKAENVLTQIATDRPRLHAMQTAGAIILAGDTVAECGGQILGKPRDEDDARKMLTTMSGQRHRVYSGVCLWPVGNTRVEPLVDVDITTLVMDPLSDEQLDAYLASGDWEGKAGAFGYQDGLDWVHVVQGSESNVVGLPMELLGGMLATIQARSASE